MPARSELPQRMRHCVAVRRRATEAVCNPGATKCEHEEAWQPNIRRQVAERHDEAKLLDCAQLLSKLRHGHRLDLDDRRSRLPVPEDHGRIALGELEQRTLQRELRVEVSCRPSATIGKRTAAPADRRTRSARAGRYPSTGQPPAPSGVVRRGGAARDRSRGVNTADGCRGRTRSARPPRDPATGSFPIRCGDEPEGRTARDARCARARRARWPLLVSAPRPVPTMSDSVRTRARDDTRDRPDAQDRTRCLASDARKSQAT